MKALLRRTMLHAGLAASMAMGGVAGLAVPPRDTVPAASRPPTEAERAFLRQFRKAIGRPAPRDAARMRERARRMEMRERALRGGPLVSGPARAAEAAADALTGTDRVLVILVEFDPDKPDTFRWDPRASTWDPFGKCNPSEYTGNPFFIGTPIAAFRLGQVNGVLEPKDFTYAGPAHNRIPRPLSASDASGDTIWTQDFSPQWYHDLIFRDGVRFRYDRQDGSMVDVDFAGKSVRDYYEDMSGGRYSITGEVVGWVKVPHSVWWYGADPAPGSRSGVRTAFDGGIPGAGNSASLVRDALDAVNAAHPGFNWKQYDQDGDGVIDRLWIIHAGLGEEDSDVLLDRTDYGEGGIWSHSASLPTPHTVFDDGTVTVQAGPYIMMPENCGISVLTHEYAHNLGAEDLYAYGAGQTSAGFWTNMADLWTGYPEGFEPSAMDPWHLDLWGWLDPALITDPNRVHKVTLGQASAYPGGAGMVRAAKILLPDGRLPLPVVPEGARQWWSGKGSPVNSMMTLRDPIAIPANATLSFRAVWDTEAGWDFVWVQASTDGATWTTLTNAHTSSAHGPGWVGGANGFPDDLAAAGIGGFTGRSAAFPGYQTETFDLSAFAGRSARLRFWYMTDWDFEGAGFFVDGVRVEAGGATVFSDSAAANSDKWSLTSPWQANDGAETFTHSYYLQWRNAGPTGGYDHALSDPRWKHGPFHSGMVVWYNNNHYADNEVYDHLFDGPSFGPKGRMLVVDAHPEPYRDPQWVSAGYPNEAANLSSRGMMRDAAFSRNPSAGFTDPATATAFPGRPAVDIFRDAAGWYPGAERVAGGPQDTQKWITRQWDASVVLPSTTAYPLNAPGYTAAEPFHYAASRNMANGTLAAARKDGLGYDGGTGDPAQVDGHHGWNSRILGQSAQAATVVVWNSRHAAPVVARPDRYTLPLYGRPITVAAPGVLANDTGANGWEALRAVELVSGPAHGAVSLGADGAFTYRPYPGYYGSDRFTYLIQAGYATSTTVTVSIGKAGDVDRNGLVDLHDVRLALRIAGGLQSASALSADFGNADLDLDGRIGSDDAAAILRLAVPSR